MAAGLTQARGPAAPPRVVGVDAAICDREPRGRWTYYSLRARPLAEFRHRLEGLVHPEIAAR